MKKEDDKIKEALKGSIVAPSANFKARVIHQIKAEKALQPKPDNGYTTIIDYLEILGTGYFVVLILGLLPFINFGLKGLDNKSFIILSTLFLALASCSSLLFLWKRAKKL